MTNDLLTKATALLEAREKTTKGTWHGKTLLVKSRQALADVIRLPVTGGMSAIPLASTRRM